MTGFRYRSSSDNDGRHAVVTLTDLDRGATAVVHPDLGANCTAFRTSPARNGETVEVLVPPRLPDDLRASPFHSGLPILFPFPNRVRNGSYSFQGRSYRMDALLAKGWDKSAGQAIHGLVGDKPWSVTDSGADADAAWVRCNLQMDAYADIREQFPFPCTIEVTYRLSGGELEMHAAVRNTGSRDMPMGFGIHPYFPAAFPAGGRATSAGGEITPERRGQSEVRIPASGVWELEQWMPTGRILPVGATPAAPDLQALRPLDELAFDTVYTRVARDTAGWSEAIVRDPIAGLEAFIAADTAFREWVLYAPLNRPVVALEPYSCVTDAVNLQPQGIDAGLIVLASGDTWRGKVRIGLRRAPSTP